MKQLTLALDVPTRDVIQVLAPEEMRERLAELMAALLITALQEAKEDCDEREVAGR